MPFKQDDVDNIGKALSHTIKRIFWLVVGFIITLIVVVYFLSCTTLSMSVKHYEILGDGPLPRYDKMRQQTAHEI